MLPTIFPKSKELASYPIANHLSLIINHWESRPHGGVGLGCGVGRGLGDGLGLGVAVGVGVGVTVGIGVGVTVGATMCLNIRETLACYLSELNWARARRRLSAAAFDSGLRRSAASNSGMLSRGFPDARRANPRLACAGALFGFNHNAS
jgi:hypothetical protein